jgi:GT2 family glycosyltransferase
MFMSPARDLLRHRMDNSLFRRMPESVSPRQYGPDVAVISGLARPLLSVIIVNFNTSELLIQTLQSLYANLPSFETEVFVVDNASTDDSCDLVSDCFPQVRLLRSAENIGFCRANNLALGQAQGEYLMLLNSDTVVKPGSVERMVEVMTSDPAIGLLGPRLENLDGSIQMSYNAVPSILNLCLSWFEAKKWIHRPVRLKAFVRSWRRMIGSSLSTYLSWFGEEPKTQYLNENMYLTAACLLVRKATIEDIGMLDPNIFMYADDAEFCKRAHDAGWKLLFLADATIAHVKGGTAGPRYRWTSVYPYLSSLYFVRKHNGMFSFWIAKQIALLSILLRVLVLTIRRDPAAACLLKLMRQVASARGDTGYPAT